jgi:DNA-binding NtrC family response regulator
MPARIVVVHDDPEFQNNLTTALKMAGHDLAVFADPLAAWDALEAARLTEVLVTNIQFPAGRSNGVALALMARAKRPEIRVLFIAPPEFAKDTEGLGEFLPLPVSVTEAVEAITRLLVAG